MLGLELQALSADEHKARFDGTLLALLEEARVKMRDSVWCHGVLPLLLLLLVAVAEPNHGDRGAGDASDDLPSSGPALTNLGSKLLGEGDVSGALLAFEKATKLFPNVALAWYNLAVASSRAGLLQLAESSYQKSSELSPDPDVLRSLANVLARQGRQLEAWHTHQHALSEAFLQQAASEEMMSDAAAAAMALKEYVSARRILLLCSRLHPSRPKVYIRLGHLHMTQNQHFQAVAVLLQAARLVGIHVGGGGDGFTPGLLAPGAVAELPPQHASVLAQVACALLLSLQRSALWAVVDKHRVCARLVQDLLLHFPSLLSRCR